MCACLTGIFCSLATTSLQLSYLRLATSQGELCICMGCNPAIMLFSAATAQREGHRPVSYAGCCSFAGSLSSQHAHPIMQPPHFQQGSRCWIVPVAGGGAAEEGVDRTAHAAARDLPEHCRDPA